MNYKYVAYKPRKDGSGMAANFSVSDRGCFLTLAKQKPSSGENDAFDWQENGKNKHVVSLGIPDIGSILSLFNGKVDQIKLYHEFSKEGKNIVTNIMCSPYASKDKTTGASVPRGYSFNITRGDVKFGFGVSFGEAEILKTLFNEAILNLTFQEYKPKSQA